MRGQADLGGEPSSAARSGREGEAAPWTAAIRERRSSPTAGRRIREGGCGRSMDAGQEEVRIGYCCWRRLILGA
jgi:hypothetical protein